MLSQPTADRGLARERPGDESPILPAAVICFTAVQIEGSHLARASNLFLPDSQSSFLPARRRAFPRPPPKCHMRWARPPARPDLFFSLSLDISRCQSELGHPVLHGGRVRPVGGGEAPPR